MLTKCFRVVIANDDADIRPTIINADALKQVGFDIDEGLLPYPDSSFMGYRLLTEFFSFQEKFQFIDFTQLDMGINDS